MKNKKTRGFWSYLLAAVFVIASCVPVISAKTIARADGTKTYDSIASILNEYQIFAEGDMNVNCHTVGAVVCGGTGTMDAFGDGAITDSYIANVKSTGNYESSSWYKDYEDKAHIVGTTKVYYSSKDCNVNSYFEKVETPYVDVDASFKAVKKESQAIADAAVKLTESDIEEFNWYGQKYSVLYIDLTKYNNVVIDADLYKKITHINLCGIDIEDVTKQNYMINVVGVENVTLNFGYESGGYGLEGIKGVTYTKESSLDRSKTFANGLKPLAQDAQGGQVNPYTAMKLIWNTPDAKTVSCPGLSGHMIAPNAAVSISNYGNYEGGIIAGSIADIKSEGHFYPHDGLKIDPKPVGTEVKSGVAKIVAKKVLKGDKPEEKLVFNFIVQKDGETVAKAKVTGEGKIEFSDIEYTADDIDKTYTYTISEVKGNIEGVTYDKSAYDILVKITDAGTNELKVDVIYPQSGVVFTNNYEAPVSEEITTTEEEITTTEEEITTTEEEITTTEEEITTTEEEITTTEEEITTTEEEITTTEEEITTTEEEITTTEEEITTTEEETEEPSKPEVESSTQEVTSEEEKEEEPSKPEVESSTQEVTSEEEKEEEPSKPEVESSTQEVTSEEEKEEEKPTKPTVDPSKEETVTEEEKKSGTGELEVVVYDEETGATVPGAKVTITYPDGTEKTITTDVNGSINLTKLDAGDYKVTVDSVPAGYSVKVGKTRTVVVADGTKTECKVYVGAADSEDEEVDADDDSDDEDVDNEDADDEDLDDEDGDGEVSSVATSTDAKTTSVKTGDSFKLFVPVIIMIGALAAGILLIFRRKREK